MGTSAAQESDLWKQIDDAEWLEPSSFCPGFSLLYCLVTFFSIHVVRGRTYSSCLLITMQLNEIGRASCRERE